MDRRVLVVVAEGDKFVCVTVQEDGQMRARIVDDWKSELEEEKQSPNFRILIPPMPQEEDPELDYLVMTPSWSSFDQNYWLQYFQKAAKTGVELPELILKDLNFLTKSLMSKGSKDWAAVKIQGNPKFTKLYAVLLGFKALSELRKNKVQGLKMSLKEKEGAEGNPYPGKSLSSI